MAVPVSLITCSGCGQDAEPYRYKRCHACHLKAKYAWNKANAGKVKASQRRTYEKTKQQVMEQVYAWRKANPDRAREIHRKAGAKYRANNVAKQLLKGARSRGKYEVTITEDDIVIPEFCPVLGIRLERAVGSRTGGPASPSLDRIDNTKDYVKGNVVVVSYRVNHLKNSATVEEMEKIVDFYRQLTRS